MSGEFPITGRLTFLVGGARSGKSTQEERPAHWHTIECPVEVGTAIDAVPADHLVVVDCLTVFLANVLVSPDAPESPVAATTSLLDALRRRRSRGGDTVVVSNEVGLGIHPDTELGRVYRDDLGRLNQAVAAISDRALLMVAGRALPLRDPMEFLQ
jgi:adenosyl cobinamide kinase/adenosyl cobinamide phosphate guanylyltransferase